MSRRHGARADATLNDLSILAVLRYLRPIPSYQNIEVRQEIMGFVHGDGEPEVELRQLEAFRKTLVMLADEGLRHPDACVKLELPRVVLTLSAGEDECKPSLDLEIIIEKQSWTADVWTMTWRDKEGRSPCVVFFEYDKALVWLRNLLDRTTSKWASRVIFQRAIKPRVGVILQQGLVIVQVEVISEEQTDDALHRLRVKSIGMSGSRTEWDTRLHINSPGHDSTDGTLSLDSIGVEVEWDGAIILEHDIGPAGPGPKISLSWSVITVGAKES